MKPYVLIPTLIEQPTWGGDYISTLKSIEDPTISSMILGQSYELHEFSKVSTRMTTEDRPTLELADPKDPKQTQATVLNDEPVLLQTLIDQDPDAYLGKNSVIKFGNKINTLIKLNQARGNSYQLHVVTPTADGRWQPKPESWYFLEPGVVTLGVRPEIDWSEYEHSCQMIDAKAQELSQKLRHAEIDPKTAEQELQDFIEKHDPAQFVNRIVVKKNTGIDLSSGGVHHSWEEDMEQFPLGNVVYEVQLNVYDPECTIRSFDKGKIKPDGSVREVHVADYFEYIDRSPQANNPQTHFRAGEIVKKAPTYRVTSIYKTPFYALEEISLNQEISNQFTRTNNSFHHIFVREGNLQIKTPERTITVTTGFSGFIPAAIGQYALKPFKCTHAVVLKTYVPI